MTHELKTLPEYFKEILSGTKTFEARKNDRNFKVGDILILHEYDLHRGGKTGKAIIVRVTYILQGGSFGIQDGHCVMSITKN